MINFFKLNSENFEECKEAIKNILWMYQDMIRNYCGFGHNIDFEKVNYKKYLLTEVFDEQMIGFFEEVEILKQGSLVALCCEVHNLLDEMRRDLKVYNFIKSLTVNHSFVIMPFEKEVLSVMLLVLEEKPQESWETLESGTHYLQKLDEVYKRYVLSYFQRMIEEGKRRF